MQMEIGQRYAQRDSAYTERTLEEWDGSNVSLRERDEFEKEQI